MGSNIIKTAEKYGGDYDFKNENGVFVFRLIMNIPPDLSGERNRGKYRKQIVFY